MKIQHEDMDAIDLIKDIKVEMAKVREMIAALEYVIYQKDERCEIRFFDKGKNEEVHGE